MYLESNPRDRVRAAAPALVVHALLALLILRGLGVATGLPAPEILKLVNLTPPPPPVPEVHPPRAPDPSSRREGAAAPPESRIASDRDCRAAAGAAATARHSRRARRRTRLRARLRRHAPPRPRHRRRRDRHRHRQRPLRQRSGQRPGDGDGDGRGGGYSPPRRIRGRISDRDYPAAVGEAGIGGTVSVIYAIEPDGRATDCRITRSSGNRALDATTCRLIEERFRFEPSRDRSGRPVRSRMVQDHYWETQDLPPDPEEQPRRRRGFRLF